MYLKELKTGLFAAGLLSVAVSDPVFSDDNSLFYPTRTDWTASHGETNLSVFVFNDLNGNGVYDANDRALAGIATGLSQDQSPISLARTNISGFANYPASSSQEGAVIAKVGTYSFEVFAPPGWQVTTQNTIQNRNIHRVEGSNAGLGMTEMLHPVGLEHVKFIRGTFGLPNAGSLELWQGGSLISVIELSPEDEFLMQADTGVYQLKSGGFTRPVLVGGYPVDIGTFSQVAQAAPSGTPINFEALAPYGLEKLPNGYSGLDWFNLNVIKATAGDVGYANGATNGHNVLYNSSGHPARITAASNFDFVSVDLTSAWPEAEGEELQISYFRNDTLVLQDHIGLSAYGTITYQPLLANISRIELSTVHNWQVVLDNMIVNTAP